MGSFHEEGRRLPECLTRRCEARTDAGAFVAVVVVAPAPESLLSRFVPEDSHSKTKEEEVEDSPLGEEKEIVDPFFSAVGLCSGTGAPSRATTRGDSESEIRKVLPSPWWTSAATCCLPPSLLVLLLLLEGRTKSHVEGSVPKT